MFEILGAAVDFLSDRLKTILDPGLISDNSGLLTQDLLQVS
jgi:hypothetical protein